MPRIEQILTDGVDVDKADFRDYLVTRVPADVKDDDARGDGSTDDTAAFAASAYAERHVPGGTYATTAVVAEGLYGNGVVQRNGARVYIPPRPLELNPVRKLMEALSRQRGKYQRVVLIGDSIQDFYYTTTRAKHWFSMLRENINLFQDSTDEELLTNFDDPNVANITKGPGVSFGLTGPLGHSLILDDGEYIEFTGAFLEVDVYFQRAVAAGSLVFKYNGTTYKTINCSGVAANDMHTTEVAGYVDATSSASGTHRIQASGGTVEITGLDRLGASYTGTGPEQIRFARIARAGYASTHFATTAVLTSIKAMVNAEPSREMSKQGLFIVAIGTNNMYNGGTVTTANQYCRDLVKIFSQLREAGDVAFLQPYEWSIASLSADTYLKHQAAARTACEAFNVPFIGVNAYDFVGNGTMLSSNHLDDDGNEKLFRLMVEELTNAVYAMKGPLHAGGTQWLGGYFSAFNRGTLAAAASGQDFGHATGAVYDKLGDAWIATQKQAYIFKCAGGEIYVTHDTGLTPGNTFTPTLIEGWGAGSPETVYTANPGAVWHRTNGGAGTSLYVKESGSGNTGWVAK